MIRSLKDFFRGLWVSKTPRFQHLQVEVTTRCDLPGCLMCPRRAGPERWLHQDLSWQNFERLIPTIKCFTHVHLSGWGEPLLHPRLWDMARVARSLGCAVSLTTNGMILTEAMQMQVLAHLDMVAVSLDGARADTFERLRPGADFQRITQQVAAFCSRKRSLGAGHPEGCVEGDEPTPPGPLTLRVRLRFGCDNCGNFTPPRAWGQREPKNDRESGGASQQRAHMDRVSKHFGRTQRSG